MKNSSSEIGLLKTVSSFLSPVTRLPLEVFQSISQTKVNSSQRSFKVTPPHHNFFTCFVLDGGDCCGDAAGNRDVDERELRDEEENNLEVTPITFNGEGELGTLHQVAYYENPGILMIVQSVGDQEGSKLNQGEITAHHKRSLVIVQW